MSRLHPHPDEPSHHPYGVRSSMVERLTVTQEVVGSSPIARPHIAGGKFSRPARGPVATRRRCADLPTVAQLARATG